MAFAFKDRQTAETLKRIAAEYDNQQRRSGAGYVPSWETLRSAGDKVLLPGRKIQATTAYVCYPKNKVSAAKYTKVGTTDRVIPGSGQCVILRRFDTDDGGTNELIESTDEQGTKAEITVWNLYPVDLEYGKIPFTDNRPGPCAAGKIGPLLLVVKDQWGDHYIAEIYRNLAIYKLTHCFDKKKDPLYITADLENCVGKIVRLKEFKGCWMVERANPNDLRCPEPVCVTIVGIHQKCEDCLDCYTLTDCDNATNTKITNTDLSLYENKVVRLKDDYTCWKVTRKKGCNGAQPVNVVEDYESCSDCICYDLEFCFGDTAATKYTIKTSTNLAKALGLNSANDAVGKVIEFAELDGCYTVTGTNTDCTGAAKLTVLGTKDDCSDCNCTLVEDCTTSTRYVVPDASIYGGDRLRLGDEYTGSVIRDLNGTCYKVIQGKSGECYIPHKVIQVLEAYDDCTNCGNGLTELEDCKNPGTKIKTYSDLSGFGPVSVGNVYIRDDGTCWKVTATNLTWTNVSDFTEFIAIGITTGCNDCTLRYKLIADCIYDDCLPIMYPRDMVVDDPNLFPAVGKYVRLGGYCYKVTTTTDGLLNNTIYTNLFTWGGEIYETCEDCKDAPFNDQLPIITEICEDTDGKLKFRWANLLIKNGLIVGLCDLGCEKPIACSTECDAGTGGVQSSKFEDCANPGTFIYVSLTSGLTLDAVYKLSDGTCWTYRGDSTQASNDSRTVDTSQSYADCSTCQSTVNCTCSNMPQTLTATLAQTDPINPCNCFDGDTITLTWDSAQSAWIGSTTDALCGYLELKVNCSGGDIQFRCDSALPFSSGNTMTWDCPNKKATITGLTLDSNCCGGSGGTIDVTITW